MYLLRAPLTLAFALALVGCHLQPDPGTPLHAANVVEGPVVIARSGHYFLRYRRAAPAGRAPLLQVIVCAKRSADAGYYYFTIPVSHYDAGKQVERPLADDGLEDLARARRVFWLDPDGTTHPIPVEEEEARPSGGLPR